MGWGGGGMSSSTVGDGNNKHIAAWAAEGVTMERSRVFALF